MDVLFVVVVLENTQLTGVAAVEDVLHITQHILQEQKQKGMLSSQPAMQIKRVSLDGKPVKTSGGMPISVDGSIHSISKADVVFLPSIYSGGSAEKFLSQHKEAIEKLNQWLKPLWESGAAIAAVASSVFILAEGGILGRARVPVPWAMERFLLKRYPGIQPDRHQEIVAANGIYCAGNIGSSLALAIRMVSLYVPGAVASLVTQYISPLETSFSGGDMNADVNPMDPLVVRAQSLIQQRFTQTIDFNRLAKQLAVSQRTLMRHFNKYLGITPQRYQQQLRIEASQRLLTATQLPVSMVAAEVGYTNGGYFSRLFKQRVGMTVQEFRDRQRSLSARSMM